MIPTKLKTKLPRTHAYPLGVQAISDALEGTPQFGELEAWFSRYDQAYFKQHTKHLVMKAEYYNWHLGVSASQVLIDAGLYGPRWQLHLYAVPRELNANVRECLMPAGLALVRNWLVADRTETWLQSSHRFELSYCPVSNTLSGELS